MKTLKPIFLLFGAALFLGTARVEAADGKYDVLAKSLGPYVNVFAKKTRDPNRALSLVLRLEEMSGLPAEFLNSRASVDVEFPDKVRLRAPVLGQELVICREGQDVWVYPGSRVAALLEAAKASGKLAKPDYKYALGPFYLPVPEKQLVFFPALFTVREYAAQDVEGTLCRLLDVKLMREVGRALGVTDWSARAWVAPSSQITRLMLTRAADWQITLRVESAKFSPALPAALWKPTPEQAADVTHLAPWQYQQLLKLVAGLSS